MADRRRLVPALVLTGPLAGCTGREASNDGTALLTDASDRGELHVYVLDGAGRPLMDGALDPAFRFDTQFADRERQCLVARDGSFEERGTDGEVLLKHDFADLEVCEHEELGWSPTTRACVARVEHGLGRPRQEVIARKARLTEGVVTSARPATLASPRAALDARIRDPLASAPRPRGPVSGTSAPSRGSRLNPDAHG